MTETERFDPMQIINDCLPYSTDDECRRKLGEALYALFCSFKNAYVREHERMRKNEKLYHGKHWEEMKNSGDPNAPQPVTPIIFSTVENVKADQMLRVPVGTIKPENSEDQDLARALTKICQQDLEAGNWTTECFELYGDLDVYGWCVEEVGFDPDEMQGKGCAYIRRVAPFGFMCDPTVQNPQDGRACFKFGKRTKEWFRQHYPEDFEEIEYVIGARETYHPDSYVHPYDILNETQEIIEAWVKIYDRDRKRTAVHMVKLAGCHVLEVSSEVKPSGYFMHGQYPFILTTLYPVDGTPFGLGIPDMHEAAQLYSDKLDQIVLKNAFLASHNKLFVTDASGFDPEDLADWTKDVHVGESLNGVQWQSTPPLPPYILTYLLEMRASIKTESGENDQARGQTSGGVTAASAINALQQMATKRSTMHSQSFHAKFKEAYRMLLDVEREFAQSSREVVFMSHGKPVHMTVTPADFRRIGADKNPIEYHIVIETSAQTEYTKIANNELALQLGQMYGDTIDPIAILYMMDFQDKDVVIEMIQDGRNSQLVQMRAQMEQMAAQLEELVKQNRTLRSGYAQVAGSMAQSNYRNAANRQPEQPEMTEEEQAAMLQNISQ